MQTVGLPRSGGLRWLWNPAIQRHKAFFDLTEGVHRLADSLNDGKEQSDFPDALVLAEPYLLLLKLVSSQPGVPASGLVQFGIIHRSWPDDEELVFLSRWHAVDAPVSQERAP